MGLGCIQGMLFFTGGVGFIASIVCFSLGSAPAGLFTLVLCIACFVVGGISVYGSSVSSKANCVISKNGTLTITSRNPYIAQVVKIQNDSDAIVKYEPVKLHIGAATVGGVTTGGAYTTGGYNYLAGTKKNGKYKLTANNVTIFRIQLNEAQYKSAKESTVSKYLNDSHQIQVIDDLQLSEVETRVTLQLLSESNFMYGGDAIKRGYPSYEKCVEILDWLCGIENKNEKQTENTTNSWNCPKCGKRNQNHVGTCGCGERKP